ncbi:spore coat protein YsxE [Halalkalibacterium halodurans]|uniref:spore coat protein YsxE n=1 Tax=Halalkalibacterium halodurans TaxID=86665 RepID=UPI002AA973D7|nr:spore coat protein YsxE [Halalkalibacterium halodurans]MDY7223586.1 spore coat protein YsxE [Halalkalibacterium halodurans]MDY7242807.1 spore coat protein YsxE [Halalkalibacterium halodurans]
MQQAQLPLEAILYQYDLYPEAVEDHGENVKKLVTKHGLFALKKTQMTRSQADWFVYCMRKLDRLGYRKVVPLLPTKFGEYTLTDRDTSFYVMPWIESIPYNARESQEEKLADQLGVIHRLTVKTQPFSKEQLEASYNELRDRWDSRWLTMNRFADQAERKTYMSPYELTLLTHFSFLEHMAHTAKESLEAWYETCLEKEKYRSVLCHGRLSRAHAFFNERHEPLLFNFERVALDTPARDLASFFRHSFPHALWSEEEGHRWLYRYEQHLPLLEEEKRLLHAYLSFPDPVIYGIEAYQQQSGPPSEVKHVKRLEKRLLNLRRVERFSKSLLPTPAINESGLS